MRRHAKSRLAGITAFGWIMLATGTATVAGMTLTGCGGGSDSSSTAGLTTDLTEDASRAATTGTEGATAVTAALEPLAYLEGAAGRAASVPTRAEGGSPIVTYDRSGTGTLTVTVDYGATPVTTPGGRTISGSFTLTLSADSKSATVTYNAFAVNGRTISGTVSLSDVAYTRPGVKFTITEDLTLSGYGHVAGTLQFVSTGAGKGFTIPTASLTVTPTGGSSSNVVLSGISIDPATNGNFIPQAGTATVEYPVTTVLGQSLTATLNVSYTAQSPSTGQVQISVDGAPAVSYTLPRFQ